LRTFGIATVPESLEGEKKKQHKDSYANQKEDDAHRTHVRVEIEGSGEE